MAVKKNVIVSSFGWVAISSYSNRILGFLTTLVLARFLSPEEFGVVGIAGITIQMLYICKDLGVSQAIIYHQGDTNTAANTGLIMVLGVNTGLFLIACILAPFIARSYDKPILTPVIILLSFNLVWIGLSSVPEALFRKKMEFNRLVFPNIVPVVVGSIIGITMAVTGFGVWSLVVRAMSVEILVAMLMWARSRFRPSLSFDKEIAKELFRFGKYIVGTTIFVVLLVNIDKIMVSRQDGLAALGIYVLARRIASLPVGEFGQIVCRVMFPALSRINKNKELMASTFLKMIKYASMISIPASIGLSVFGPPVIRIAYGIEWEGIYIPLRILGILSIFDSVSILVEETFKASGSPKYNQRYTIFRIILMVAGGVPVMLYLGLHYFCAYLAVMECFILILEFFRITTMLPVTFGALVRRLLFPFLVSSVLILGIYYGIHILGLTDNLFALLMGIGLVIALYLGVLMLVDRHILHDIQQTFGRSETDD